jgi:hypothetical protein
LKINTGKISKAEARNNREKYMQYFNGKGKVPWQDVLIKLGKA